MPTDVNASGEVSPIDALLPINELNNRLVSDPVTGLLDLPANPPPFYDVNNDGFVSPVDPLMVINALTPTDPPTLVAPNAPPVGGSTVTPVNESALRSGASNDNESQPVDVALRAFIPSQDRDGDRYDQLRGQDDRDVNVVDELLAEWSQLSS